MACARGTASQIQSQRVTNTYPIVYEAASGVAMDGAGIS